MIKSKEAVQLLVFLIINCHTRQGVMVMGASTYYKQSGQEMGEQQQKHQPQQQVANVELSYASQNNQENPKRYIMQGECLFVVIVLPLKLSSYTFVS